MVSELDAETNLIGSRLQMILLTMKVLMAIGKTGQMISTLIPGCVVVSSELTPRTTLTSKVSLVLRSIFVSCSLQSLSDHV